MIKKIQIEVHTAICDGCGKDFYEGTGFTGWKEREGVEAELDESWYTDHNKNKHYCPKCWTKIDEEAE